MFVRRQRTVESVADRIAAARPGTVPTLRSSPYASNFRTRTRVFSAFRYRAATWRRARRASAAHDAGRASTGARAFDHAVMQTKRSRTAGDHSSAALPRWGGQARLRCRVTVFDRYCDEAVTQALGMTSSESRCAKKWRGPLSLWFRILFSTSSTLPPGRRSLCNHTFPVTAAAKRVFAITRRAPNEAPLAAMREGSAR